MRRWPGLLITGVVVYLIALVANFPASHGLALALPYLEQAGVELEAAEVSGSIWSGRIGEARVERQRLQRVRWSLRPGEALAARIGADWRTDFDGGHLQGRLALDAGGRLLLSRTEGRIPMDLISNRLPLPVVLGGELALNLEQLTLADGVPESARGVVLVSGARVVSPQAVELGDLRLVIAPVEGGGIRAELADAGGPLEATGSLVLAGDRSYRLDALVSPRADADPVIGQVLPMLGQRTPAGKYRVEFTGTL
jgi:hypothetical protein